MMKVLVRVAVAAAAAGVAGLAVAGCASSAAAPPPGSVQACTAFGVRAIKAHRTVTQVPAACRGLSRADVNFALGRSIYLVAGSGHHKVAWRQAAAVAGARLARLITTAMAQSPGAAGASSAGAGGRPGPVDRRPLGVATLVLWLLTMAAGGCMLLPFVMGGRLRRQRAAGDRTSPAVVLTHVGLASSGLLLWAVYLATSWLALAWVAVSLLLPVIGFGMATLIVWTSGSSRSRASAPGSTSGTPGVASGASPASTEPSGGLSSPSPASTEPSRPGTGPSPAGAPGQVQVAEAHGQGPAGQTAPGQRPSRWLTVIIPITHGLLAMTTILLALLTALGAT